MGLASSSDQKKNRKFPAKNFYKFEFEGKNSILRDKKNNYKSRNFSNVFIIDPRGGKEYSYEQNAPEHFYSEMDKVKKPNKFKNIVSGFLNFQNGKAYIYRE